MFEPLRTFVEECIDLITYSVCYCYCVGGVAQWLERRSLTGKLPWSTPDLWL